MYNLEQEYTEDSDWYHSVQLHLERWKDCPYQQELLAGLSNHEDIAIMTYSAVGLGPDDVNRPIPILDGESIASCLRDYRLILRLRVYFSQAPG